MLVCAGGAAVTEEGQGKGRRHAGEGSRAAHGLLPSVCQRQVSVYTHTHCTHASILLFVWFRPVVTSINCALCPISRAGIDDSKKWGMLFLVNQLFKIYFKVITWSSTIMLSVQNTSCILSFANLHKGCQYFWRAHCFYHSIYTISKCAKYTGDLFPRPAMTHHHLFHGFRQRSGLGVKNSAELIKSERSQLFTDLQTVLLLLLEKKAKTVFCFPLKKAADELIDILLWND